MKLAILSLFLFLVSGVFPQGVGSEAQLKKLPSVKYPAEAHKTSLEGTVGVNVEVDQKGKVTKVIGVFGPGFVCPSIDRADVVAMRQIASRAAEKAEFIPATKDGKAVASQMLIRFEFMNPSPKKPVDGGLAVKSAGSGALAIRSDNEREKSKEDKATGDSNAETPRMTMGLGGDYASKVETAPPSSTTTDAKTVNGAVLNGKAISLPKPAYPAAARAIRAGGAVTVQVIVDTNGTIFSANSLSGHPLLRAAARNAACSARFSPTLLSGEPVKVAGVIVYNFVP